MRYEMLIIEPLKEMLTKVGGFIPALIDALLILVVGYIVAKVLHRTMHELMKIIKFDKIADKAGLSHVLKTGGISHKPGDMISLLVYYVTIVIFLIITVKAVGLTMVSALLDKLLAYIPHVISGVMALIFGLLLAKVVAGLVHVVAKNFDAPKPEVLSHLTKLAIVIYVVFMFLKEVGLYALFVGTNFTILFSGFVFALALAFGLGGRDIAGKYLEVFKKNGHK